MYAIININKNIWIKQTIFVIVVENKCSRMIVTVSFDHTSISSKLDLLQ